MRWSFSGYIIQSEKNKIELQLHWYNFRNSWWKGMSWGRRILLSQKSLQQRAYPKTKCLATNPSYVGNSIHRTIFFRKNRVLGTIVSQEFRRKVLRSCRMLSRWCYHREAEYLLSKLWNILFRKHWVCRHPYRIQSKNYCVTGVQEDESRSFMILSRWWHQM